MGDIRRDQTHGYRLHNRFGAATGLHLFKDARNVSLDGTVTNSQLGGNSPVREPLGSQSQHFHFTVGKVDGNRRAGWR